MKKMIPFLFMMCGLPVLAQEALPTQNAIWTLSIVDLDDKNFETNKGTTVYKIDGDTLIEGTTYHKFYHFDWWGRFEEAPPFEEAGAFRIDGKKAWYNPDGKGIKENLLYDFGANVGDTIWHGTFGVEYYEIFSDPFMWGTYFSIVENISVTDAGKEFKVTVYMEYESGDAYSMTTDTWIEGVGSLRGFFDIWLDKPMCSYHMRKLWSSKAGETLIYPKEDPGKLPHSLSQVEIASIDIQYMWNPDQLSVQANESVYPCQLRMIDMKGNVLCTHHLEENAMIPMSTFPSGIYVCTISKDGETAITKKIAK